jgi:RNA polymerase sigma-70 factor (ECF subfamily)
MGPLEQELAAMHPASFGWALACTGRDKPMAEDVLQEVYWKVLSGRARYSGRSPLRTWLFGVIRLTALEMRRRWARRAPPADVEPDELPASSRPKVDRETAAALATALVELPERQREVLHLVFYEGLTIAEAAVVMEVSLGTARVHYERGKASLLARLEKGGVTSP